MTGAQPNVTGGFALLRVEPGHLCAEIGLQDLSTLRINDIEDQLSNLQKIGIIFICTREGREEDDWTEEDGMRYIVIDLPYEEVHRMPDARPLMLAKAQERLGLVA